MSDIEKNNVEDDINLILESIISGEELDNSDNLLETINNSNQNFSNINMQLENIIDKYSSVGDIAFGYIANALKSSAADHILGIAEDIYDTNLKKYQSEINSSILSSSDALNTYLPLAGGTMTGTINSNHIFPAATNTYNLGRNHVLQYRNVYSKEFTEDGVSLAAKYAPIAHNHDNVYKPLQTPVTDPINDTGAAITFIGSITQDKNGVISAEKKTVPTMTGATASSDGLIGLVPVPTAGKQSSFLRGDGSWNEIPIYTGANFESLTIGTPGLVPTCASNRADTFLRGDGRWVQPRTMTGATSSNIGASGFVPAPAAGDQASFLRGDGTWREIPIYTGANMATTTNGIPGLVPECPAGRAEAFLRGDGHWATPANATTSAAGFMSSADKTKLDGIEEGANNYSLPIATTTTLGGVKVGSGLGINSSGVLGHSTSAGYKHIPSGGSSGQYLKYSSSGTATWATPANNTATASAAGFMSAEDKTKLDRVHDYHKLTIDTSSWDGVGSIPDTTALVDDVDKFANIKFGDRIRICSSEDFENSGYGFNPFKNLSKIIVAAGEFSYKLRCLKSDDDVQTSSMTGAGLDDFQLGSDSYDNYNLLYKYGGYIDAIIIGWDSTDTSGDWAYLYAPIYNSHKGYISKISQSSKTIKITSTDENATHPLVFTNNVTAGNKSLYTDSENSCHYNPSTTTLTVPIISASGSCAFGSSTNVKGILNIKGSNHNSDVITLRGNTSTEAPYILIRAAGSSSTEAIRLTGRTSSVSANIKVYSSSGSSCTITGGSTSISSDERLKNFENDIEIDFDKLKNIPKKYFTWKHDDKKVLNIGTSAQEVEKIYPEIVEEFLNENEGKNYKSVDYSKLSIIALAAIDKLNERITELENKLKEYEQ